MRASILELNKLCCGDFDRKYTKFCEQFGYIFKKEKFRRKVSDFTAFVKNKSYCKADKRKIYITKYGMDAWGSLSADERDKHQATCHHCVAEPKLFADPTSKRNKQNPKKTPVKSTPLLKKSSSRRAIQRMNREVNETSKRWEENYDSSFVEVLRKNRTLNVTPRKSKLAKMREKRYLQKKVYIICNKYFTILLQ